MLKEFKDFAMRGNVVDMAVGIIIGGAFGTIIKSLVSDIIMPPVGMLMGGVDFAEIFFVLSGERAATIAATQEAGGVTLNVGLFINSVIAFVIVAFALFLLIKAMNKAKAEMEEPEAPAEPAAPPKQEVLLEEIRDLLKK